MAKETVFLLKFVLNFIRHKRMLSTKTSCFTRCDVEEKIQNGPQSDWSKKRFDIKQRLF